MKIFNKISNYRSNSALESSLVFTVLTFLQPVISFFLLPIYLNILMPSEFGIYTIIITFSSLIPNLVALKIESGIMPFYYDYKTNEDRIRLLNTVISFILICIFFFSILSIFLGFKFFDLIFINEEISFYPYGLLAISGGLLLPILTCYLAFVKNEKKIIRYAQIQLVLIISNIILQLSLIFTYKLTGLLIAKTLSPLFAVSYIFFQLKKDFYFCLDKKIIKSCLKYSLALIPFFLVFWLGRYVDRFILEQNISLEQLGIYGLMMTFILLIASASEALANSVQPFLFELYNNLEVNEKKINRLYKFYINNLTVFVSILIFIVSNISVFISNPIYLDVIPYFYFAIIPAFIDAFQYIYFNVYTFKKKSKELSRQTIVLVFLQIVLILTLVKTLGLYSAILASLIISIIKFIWYHLESRSFLRVRYNWKKLILMPLLLLFIIVFANISVATLNFNYQVIGSLIPIPFVFIFIKMHKEKLALILSKIRLLSN